MRILLSTFVLLFSCATLHAQGIFRDLTAVQYGDSILLNWTLSAGATCFDMHLQRADHSDVFTTVYSVPGVCGGSDDQYYDFTDHEALSSGTNYAYRVTASNELYSSDTVQITFVDAGDNALFVYPNPVQDMLLVTIDNQYTPTFLIEVYDASGKQMDVRQQPNNLFMLETLGWEPGLYIVKVTTRNGEMFATDFIVL